MSADICDPDDALTLARFRHVLQTLGAEYVREYGADFQFMEVRIGEELLTIVADPWSVDIEGSIPLVQHIVSAMAETRP